MDKQRINELNWDKASLEDARTSAVTPVPNVLRRPVNAINFGPWIKQWTHCMQNWPIWNGTRLGPGEYKYYQAPAACQYTAVKGKCVSKLAPTITG